MLPLAHPMVLQASPQLLCTTLAFRSSRALSFHVFRVPLYLCRIPAATAKLYVCTYERLIYSFSPYILFLFFHVVIVCVKELF